MSDDDLARLFRDGPTPDRDEAFADAVMVDLARLRARARAWLALRLLGGVAVLGALAVITDGRVPLPAVSLPDLSPLGGRWLSPSLALQALGLAVVAAELLRRRIRIVAG